MRRFCAKHGIVDGPRCPHCTDTDNQRRHAKQRAHGRNTRRWQRIRREVIARDQGRCQRCGKAARTVHIDPKLGARHDIATIDDCRLLCASCHGTIDAPRATGGSTGRGAGSPRSP